MASKRSPVLILGGGINGAAIARELVLNGVPVVLVDRADLSFGATAYSSRLIHGGLRYLEYAEFDLVRESLGERRRLLELAPHLVRPLRLFIPAEGRLGGWTASVLKFFGRKVKSSKPRGMWLVRTGLWLYDRLAGDKMLPSSAVKKAGAPETPPVDDGRYHWLCSYWDAQIRFPERFVVAQLEDARRLAEQQGVEFRVLTYHEAKLLGDTAEISSMVGSGEPICIAPAAIVNATGAWVDDTLARLEVSANRLMGGTKGSHFFTRHKALREAIGDDGIYMEAADGRPMFILPFGDAVLVGTTDVRFEGDPADAVATDQELTYLRRTVRMAFPEFELKSDDIDLHYAGVRPLPYVDAATPGAITRRHAIKEHPDASVPLYSIIGGKLTTCRSLAEDSLATLRDRLGLSSLKNSRDRVIPGGENYPAPDELDNTIAEVARSTGYEKSQVKAVWQLLGTRTESLLGSGDSTDCEPLDGAPIPRKVARWIIENEWVATLDDLVERRLMLLYHPELSQRCLERLAEMLVAAGKIEAAEATRQVERTILRLREHFGKTVVGSAV